MSPNLSIVICAYNMPRELPRTIRSLSPAMQRGVQKSDYEIIVMDNGSTSPVDEDKCRSWGADLKVSSMASASPSPAQAVNLGFARARGELIGVLIDGARLASPGIIRSATMAARLSARAVILTLGFHLGPEIQMDSILKSYDQDEEDRLLTQSGWTEDGYRLFDISVFAASSTKGWFSPMNESNAIFMRRELWDELGGFDERFQSPGGGFVNLDMLVRALQLPGIVIITLLGEGTFHQIHGGVATNALRSMTDVFHAEYREIRGQTFQTPVYQSLYFGSASDDVLASIADAAHTKLRSRLNTQSV